MIPGLGNPKNMSKMLKQMGMQMDNIPAKEVIIKTETGELVIKNPQVVKTTMQGQTVYQVSGNEEKPKFTDEDVNMVMEQTGKNKEEVIKALEETNGDIAEAIMKLSE